MPKCDLTVTNDVSAGAWIAPRLRGEFGAVSLTVPSGYPAYARICHPASDARGRLVRWSEVADATGRMAHPLMQWHALVGSSDPHNFKGSLWPGGDPERGDLAPNLVDVLAEHLRRHTIEAEHCFFAVWDGWAWVHGGGVRVFSRLENAGASSSEARPEIRVERAQGAFSTDELARPRLVLPGREYLLLEGALSAVKQLGDLFGLEGFSRKSPNLFWPADHTWCVASEIDFDSTLVGGSTDLIEAVLDTPELDAWRVKPDDSLAADGDHINHLIP